MAETSVSNPHLFEDASALAELFRSVILRYGEFSVGTTEGEVGPLFLEMTNLVLDDVRSHPYWTGGDISYPRSKDEKLVGIPDSIIVSGILAHYATQQQSEKAKTYVPMYQRQMNQLLWYAMNGNEPIQFRIVDGGTNPANANGAITSSINGKRVLSDDE